MIKKDNNYYVYVHRKKSNGAVFYVGKGKGGRAWATSKTVNRSKLWRNTSDKYGFTVEIILDNLQEWYAFEIECELILKYGRIDIGTGCLVNHTDGGDGTSGWIPSKQYRTTMSKRMTGSNHPLFKAEVNTYINMRTGEVFIGTLFDLNHKFNMKFLKSNPHTRGWYVEGSLTATEINAFLTKFSGANSYNYLLDKNTYSFTNLVTLEVLVCPRYEIQERTGVNVSSLFGKAANGSVYGWCLTSTLENNSVESLLNTQSGSRNGRADKTIYSFIRLSDSLEFIGTRFDLQKEFNINISDLFAKTRTPKSCKGWSLLK
jgi:hypothetical protein